MTAKLQLSQEEWKLIADPGWILTKNSVLGRIVEMMAGLSEEYKDSWANLAREGVRTACGPAGTGDQSIAGSPAAATAQAVAESIAMSGPKISRGENYRGLPWIMLDYPRVFGREDVFAIRTMFWWGHGFSVTLHLKGKYQELFLPVIRRHQGDLSAAGFHVSINEDEWRHELAPEVYESLEVVEIAAGMPFLKLSALITLDSWTGPGQLKDLYRILIKVLA